MPAAPPARSIPHYGWKPDLPDKRDQMFAPEGSSDDYPDSIDLRQNCPEVYDQGHIGSCTANAIAAAFEFELIKQGLEDFPPSRLFIYYNARQMEGHVAFDAGAHLRDGMKTVSTQGVCSESDWPYDGTRANKDHSWPAGAPAGQEPPEEYYAKALENKAVKYKRLNQDIDHMKDCLVQGYPFVGGITVYPSFNSHHVAQTGIVPMPGRDESPRGGHALLIVGYDDSKGEDDQGAWLVRNSWGPQWGEEGYCWIPYDYLTDSGLSRDFWTLRVVSEGQE